LQLSLKTFHTWQLLPPPGFSVSQQPRAKLHWRLAAAALLPLPALLLLLMPLFLQGRLAAQLHPHQQQQEVLF
jgi:hypothetical protein